MQPWKRINPTIVTKIDYHNVVVKTFELPNGEITTRATFLGEGRRAAGLVAVTEDNKVVVAKQFRPGPEKIMYEIPGGWVDDGEEPEAAARRELLEETGYTAKEIKPLGVFGRDSAINGSWYYYLATGCEKTHDQSLDSDEFVDIELVTIDDFLKNAKSGNMTDPFAVLGAYDELMNLKGKTNETTN
jgi:ADP-ribose pyrophosphatase